MPTEGAPPTPQLYAARAATGVNRALFVRESTVNQLSPGVSGVRLGRRTCRFGGRASGERASGWASEPVSGLAAGGRGSGRGPGGRGPLFRCSGRRPVPGAPWRRSCCRSGCLSKGRSDSRFPGASVISISMISSHCSSVRSRSGMLRSSRSRRRGSRGGVSFMLPL
jgi:hypothetical protein